MVTAPITTEEKGASGSRSPGSSRRFRKAPALAGLATLGLVSALLVPALGAQAATSDSLNVGFNGSLVTTTAYTTTGDEVMHGVLNRVNGAEEQVPQSGVQLAGGTQGIRYAPTDMTTGTDTADQGFLGEVKFTPTASATMSTIFSAGGNFYIRAQNNELHYGFDSFTNSKWATHKATTAYPALNQEHAVSFHYLPTPSGVTLSVMLDGVLLPPVTSPTPSKNAVNLGSVFGFGYEVNTQGADRGFTGTLHEVRLAKAAAAFQDADFEFQPRPASTDLLDVSYDGTLAGNTYTKATTEVLAGALARRSGTETLAEGKVALAAAGDGIDFTATDFPLGTTKLDKGFVAEAVFTPTGTQVAQGTVIGVGGNLFARYTQNASGFEYGFSSNASGKWVTVSETIALPEVNKAHTFSMVYAPNSDGTADLIAGMDGKLLTPLKGAQAVKNSSATTTVSFGAEVRVAANNRALKGSLDKTRFAALTAGYDAAAVKYQDLVEPEPEVCEPLLLDPANYISVSTGDCTANVLAKSALVRPTVPQLEWQESRQTAFVHFGINTFYNQEWGHGTEDPARFNPTDFDADSWVKTLRDNGFRYTVLTVKHHDGFMSYPSRYTDYTVASSPWKAGKGDVVKEFTDAAHKYGMKVGLYMSPADSNQEVDGVFGNGSAKSTRTIPTLVAGDDRAGKDIPQFTYEATDYGSFFLNTLYEILTQYGQVDEVWFDGAQGNTGKQEFYDYPAFYDMIAQLQPNALVAVGGNDIKWIGNEQGIARDNEWGVLPVKKPADGGKITPFAPDGDANLGSTKSMLAAVKTGSANNLHWWPGEADMKLTQGWFAHPNDSPKSPSAMLTKYHESAGRNAVLLLNVPPTTTGKFAESSNTALAGFTNERAKAFTLDHALGLPVSINGEASALLTDGNFRSSATQSLSAGGTFEINLGSAKAVDRIALSEDVLNHGQNVDGFTVEAKVNGTWTKVTEAGTVGVLRILKFNTTTAQEFRVTIKGTRTPAFFANVSLYGTLAAAPAPLMDLYVDCKAPVAGIGTQARPFNSMEQFRQTEIATSASIHFKAGTDCAASDTPFWGYGTTAAPITVSTYGDGAAALVGGKSLADTFAKRADQGWVVSDALAPATPTVNVDATTVTAGETSKLQLSGFTAGQEITVELRPGAISLGKVTANAQGNATLTVTVPANITAGDFTIAATQATKTATTALQVLAATTPSATATATATATTEPTVEPSATATASASASGSASATTAPPTTDPSVEPSASTPAAEDPTGALSAGSVAAGAKLTITGENFKPGTTATFTLYSDPVELGTATVLRNGTVNLTTMVPANVPAGEHTVVIAGTDTFGDSAEVSLALVVTAADDSTSATPTTTSASTSTSATSAPSTPAANGSPSSPANDDLAHTGASLMPGLLLALVLLLAGGISVLMVRRRGKRA
ncbi:alpha-L-fucosidase [Arthrobacter psychrochitiniphilus]|uniref:alpha-L-fucosidase n=1 Tax=Arthrobacter psychrochitiniphilus TaxID=291045 RepID=UPI003F7CAF0D